MRFPDIPFESDLGEDAYFKWSGIMKELVSEVPGDFTIKCGGQSHSVHKFVLSSQSRFFKNAVNGPFKEAQCGILDLSDEDPHAVKAMVNHMYFGSYGNREPTEDATQTKSTWYVESLPLHAKIYVLGDKYDVDDLCTDATCHIQPIVVKNPGCATNPLFLDAVRIIYSGTTAVSGKMVRKVLVKAMAKQRNDLNQEGPKAVMREFLDLAIDLATATSVP